ncbi:MAG: shikimate kinase [Zetaproteobacteria bacterium]|nr:MAG: shikimate kinase [Zetaproteobacteria bacterium]
MAELKPIALVGLMGAGKSTVGRLVAARLRCPFWDMDDVIGQLTQKTIPQIFADEGEPAFRALEHALLRALLTGVPAEADIPDAWRAALEGFARTNALPAMPAVIATGGGIVERADNRRLLAQHARVVWLDAPPEALAARVGRDPGRPLLAGVDPLARMRELAARRTRWYAQIADIRIRADEAPPEAIAEAIVEELR